ncbi:sodium:sulfate symporter, partial [bacterium M00.F.Ca.ET.199.01.1.1]
VTSNAEPALFVPVVSRVLAQSAHLKAGLLMQVMGYATTFMPYQSPPVVFGNELARLDRRAALKYCIVTALLGLAFVLPVNAIWWRLLGLL